MTDHILDPNHKYGFLTKLAVLADYMITKMDKEELAVKKEFVQTLASVRHKWDICNEERFYRYIEKYEIDNWYNDDEITFYYDKYFT